MAKWTYIDLVTLRDWDSAASRKLSKGSLLPGRRGEVPERSEGDEGALFTLGRADVSAIFDNSGAVIEWQKYSAYGVPFLLTPGDHGKDGGISAADQTAFNADYAANNARADLNRDGAWTTADQTLFTTSYNAAAVGGRWKLSANVANRKGYAGYEHEGFGNDLAAPELAHVRHRVLHFGLGRWTRRDPMGYVDGVTLISYVQSQPIRQVDPAGLTAWAWECLKTEPYLVDGATTRGSVRNGRLSVEWVKTVWDNAVELKATASRIDRTSALTDAKFSCRDSIEEGVLVSRIYSSKSLGSTNGGSASAFGVRADITPAQYTQDHAEVLHGFGVAGWFTSRGSVTVTVTVVIGVTYMISGAQEGAQDTPPESTWRCYCCKWRHTPDGRIEDRCGRNRHRGSNRGPVMAPGTPPNPEIPDDDEPPG
ncbi:MAG: hypothetical protein KF699_05925 [Phycisphaeraceae bacterium]|nr:hypothetical protein [Phycisphaeraceae bacterium]